MVPHSKKMCFRFTIQAFFIVCFLAPAIPAYAQTRTYDALSSEEIVHLTQLEERYFDGIRDEAVKMVTTFFDTHTIIQTFTPQARIIRQRKREMLNDVLRYLCSLDLEQEFISNYIHRLRDDAVDYAVDAMLQKSRGFRR